MELHPDELQALGERVVSFITRHLTTLEQLPAMPAGLDPGELRRLLAEPLPRQGQGVAAALQDFLAKIVPNSAPVGHPRFLAWIRPAPLGVAIYAEALAAALNQSVAVWEGAPAAAEVELRVIEWFKEMSGYAPQAGGLLTSGGSVANFVCLLAARSAADPNVREHGLAGGPSFTLYLTAETHYCVPKAAEMMGIGRRYVRVVPVDAALRMDPQALAAMIRADRQAGLRPLAVAATLGTVNSGACDDLVAISQVCRAEGVWLHVDGAYGGLAALVPHKRPLAEGLAEADSLVFDPHKGLFIPFEAGCALVRDPAHLPAAFAIQTDYLPNTELDETTSPFTAGSASAPVHFRDYGPQLSRSFRALKIYLSLKVYGIETLAAALAEQYRLAQELGRRIQASPDFELSAPVPLGIVAFRYLATPPSGEADLPAWLDRLNAQIVAQVQRRGQVFLAGTRLQGRCALRVCFVSHRTSEQDLDIILDEIRAAARELLQPGKDLGA